MQGLTVYSYFGVGVKGEGGGSVHMVITSWTCNSCCFALELGCPAGRGYLLKLAHSMFCTLLTVPLFPLLLCLVWEYSCSTLCIIVMFIDYLI